MFLGLQQIKEKPGGWSGISKDPSYKNGPRDTGTPDSGHLLMGGW